MKQLLEFLPIILFFIAYKMYDIFVATGVAIVASAILIGWFWMRGKKVEPMQWISLAIIVIFGGMTLLFQDETFIKWKPSVLYLAFAAVLIGGQFLAGRNLISLLMGSQISLPNRQWSQLNWAWIVFFVAMAALNLFIAYTFSTDTWVNFKLFGALGLTLLFVIGQAFWMSRYMTDEQLK